MTRVWGDMSPRRRLPALAFCALMLSSCISTEPRQLVPSMSLSPETISLSSGEPIGAGLNFGMNTGINESDSLSNITILPGIRVRSVTPNAAADLAGIRAGDVILTIDQREINHPDLLEALAQQSDSTQSFQFQVRRNTTVFETQVNARAITDARSEPVELYRADPIASRAGYTTEIFDTAGAAPLSGARLVTLFPDSPLAAADFQIGDTVLAVNGVPVSSAQGLITLLHTQHELGETVSMTVARDNLMTLQTVEKSVQLWHPGRRLSRLTLGPLLRYESSLSPQQRRLSVLDLWLFSLFTYEHSEGETQYSVLGLFRFATGYGELLEETGS
jgi:serine protease Do